jgi:predicted PurR-regulated permease PerM
MPTAAFRKKDSTVPRVVSFIVLLAILLLMGAVFFQVMAHFVVPLFLAAVLVVVFKPLHASVLHHIPGYVRLAALLTTLLILLVVLLPAVWLGWRATLELRDLYEFLNTLPAAKVTDALESESIEVGNDTASDQVDVDVTVAESNAEPLATGDSATEANADAASDDNANDRFLTTLVARIPKQLKEAYRLITGKELEGGTLRDLIVNARGLIGSVVLGGTLVAVKLIFGLIIMVLALYYFLADGPKMLASMMKLSPLDDEYERELLDKFANISRAVVVASLASAAAQGLLAGLGYSFALDKDAPSFLLTMLTMVFAIVPFAGAAAVWVPTAIWIYLYQPVYENGKPLLDAAGEAVRGDTFTAVCLAIYGACVVSAIDNVIKPLVLHGQSNLHPLIALISILGGVQTLGPIGILVGPMLVAFIQALMNMINKELLRLGDGTIRAPSGPAVALPMGPATIVEAEAAAGPGILGKLAAAAASEPPAPSDDPADAAKASRSPPGKRRRPRK